jgi:amino acid adenylation domain-containing protein
LEDSRALAVLTTAALKDRLPPIETASIIYLDTDDGIAEYSSEPLEPQARSHHLAYVIYTSGSVGKPKGVMVEHRNATSFFVAMDRILGVEPGVWLAISSILFDISVLELFWTLASGFRVILHPEGAADTIPGAIQRHGVTHLQCTPSLANLLASDPASLRALRPLRRLLVGGETLPASLARQLREAVSGDVVNMYGPTEATVWSTAFRLGDFTTNVPIGRPLSNTYVRILDSALQPVIPGEPGELFIGGEGVARGYWEQPELTAERFLRDPLGGTGRLYRTGDLACFRADGELEFLGRMDCQVKIGGFRIDLEEIDAALERMPEVRQAVVVAREDRPGDRRLVVYVAAKPGHAPTSAKLRASLAEILPEQIIPSTYRFVDRIPLTANGKVDRNALFVQHAPSEPASEMPANASSAARGRG